MQARAQDQVKVSSNGGSLAMEARLQWKVLFVIESLGRGGAEQALVNLLPTLQSRGYRCEVAALQPPYDLAAALETAGIRVHRLNLRHRWSAAEAIIKLAWLIRRQQFDVLHAHLFFANIYTAMTKLFLRRPRRVVSFHGFDYDFYPSRTGLQKARKALDAWLMRSWIDRHTAVSQAVARHYVHHLGLKGVDVIANAFPLDTLRPSADLRPEKVLQRERVLAVYGIAVQDFLVIMPARLVPEKGHTFFLQAMEILRGRGLFPRALFLGNGPLRAQIEAEVARRNLQNQVVIHNSVPHTQLMPLLQVSGAFVLASTHEGLPLAVGEAMAMERPVLVTDVGGLRSLVEDGITGIMVPPSDPPALADGLARLMGDAALCQRLGRAARQRILESFSAESIADHWEDFYRDLVTM